MTISLYAVRGALDALEALDALATLAAHRIFKRFFYFWRCPHAI